MNCVYCKREGELCMLITRTDINVNYYKLDNIKSCLKFKQSADKFYSVLTALYTLLDKNCLMHTRTHCVATAPANW